MKGRHLAVLCAFVVLAQALSSFAWDFFAGVELFTRREIFELATESVGAGAIFLVAILVARRLMAPRYLAPSLPNDPATRKLFIHAPEAILVIREGLVVSANFAAAALFGAGEPTHLLGMRISALQRPRFVDPRQRRLADQSIDDEFIALMEEKCRRLDGESIDVEAWGGPCLWEGKPAIQIFARDITWRKHTQELLEKSETQLNGIFASVGDAIAVHDMGGRLIKVNQEACAAFGYSEAEMLGLRFDQLMVGKPVEHLLEQWLRIESGARAPILKGEGRRKDGSEFPLEIRLGVYRRGEGGTLIVALARDVSERVEAERAAAQAQSDLLETIKGVDAGIALFDPEERLVFCNDVFRQIYSSVAKVLVPGMTYEEFARAYFERGPRRELNPDSKAAWVEMRLKKFREGRESSAYRRGDRWLQRLRFETPGGGRLIVINDVTERRRTEMALMESEALFRVAFENALVAISLRSVDRTVARFNAAFCQMFGYSEAELGGMSLRDIALPDGYEKGEFRQPLLNGEKDNIQAEQRFVHKDGHIIWTLASHSVVRDAEGKPAFIITAFSDITEQRQAVEALRDSEARYRTIVSTAEEGIWLFDRDRKTIFVNKHLAEFLGVDENELIGSTMASFIGEQSRTVAADCMERCHGGQGGRYDICLRHSDGSDIWAIIAVNPLFGEDGTFSGALGMVTDITQRKEAEEALRDHNTLLQTLIDAIPAPIYYKDEKGVYLGCNAEFEKFLGRPAAEIVGKTVFDVATQAFADKNDSSDKSLIKKGGKIAFESAVKWADGSPRDVIFHKAVFERADGSTAGLVGAMVDITLRKKAEEQLRHMANFDGLTGVPNRNLGKDRLVGALARARRAKTMAAVLFVDLDGFKQINDTHGHEIGDKLLKEVAKRLTKSVRETDTVSRFGGDEFTIIATDLKERSAVARIAQNVLDGLAEPFKFGEIECRIGASIGISLYPDDGADSDSLVKAADTAMYAVKMKGKGTFKFASDPASRAAE